MKARTRKAAAMASSLDPIIDAIIAVAGRAVNTRPYIAASPPEPSSSSPLRKGISMTPKKITRQDLRDAAEKYRNWGKWGPNDEIGTLNHTGPQGAKSNYPAMGRTSPIHTMIRTGTDAYSGVLDKRGIRAADDMVTMPLQCGTQWDGLGHVFYESHMWNGYDCREVTSA